MHYGVTFASAHALFNLSKLAVWWLCLGIGIERAALAILSKTAVDVERCHWLKPQRVETIEFLEWTVDGHLRHPNFVALGDDRVARAIIREHQ